MNLVEKYTNFKETMFFVAIILCIGTALATTTQDIEELIRNGIDLDFQNETTGWSQLHSAAAEGNVQVIDFLIRNGANLHLRDLNESTPLWLASKNGHGKAVEFLVSKGANIHDRDFYGLTTIAVAAKGGYENIVDFLIEKGAKINFQDNEAWTPLHHSIMEGKIRVVDLLIRKGAFIYRRGDNGMTPLHVASREGQVEIVELLLTKGANINARNIGGKTALFIAATETIRQPKAIINALLKKGADMTIKDNDDRTILFSAAQINRTDDVEIVDFLITSGVDVNSKNRDGKSAMHGCAQNGTLHVAELLIEKGANINLKDQIGNTPLIIAAAHGKADIIELLIENGASINAQNEEGATALHYAANRGHANVVELLLKNNVFLNIKDNAGLTAIDYADNQPKTFSLLKSITLRTVQRVCETYTAKAIDLDVSGSPKSRQYLWMAALGYIDADNQVTFDCEGTIISEYYILTSAFCVSKAPIVARMGQSSVFTKKNTVHKQITTRQIEERTIHPNYSPLNRTNDIGLIRVTQQIWFTDKVIAACLHTNLADEKPDEELIATGWGSVIEKRQTDLLTAHLRTTPLSECNRTLIAANQDVFNDRVLEKGVTESQYCAFDPMMNEENCLEATGGPLQIFPNNATIATVVGIASYDVGCGTTTPDIYTRVASYLDWIEPIVWPRGV